MIITAAMTQPVLSAPAGIWCSLPASERASSSVNAATRSWAVLTSTPNAWSWRSTSARLMTLHAAWRIDSAGASAARQEIALIKFFGAGVLHDVVDRALQAHGALGYSTDLPLEAMYRYARAARIYDGPDEVHRDTVARLVLQAYEAPADGVPSEHLPTRRADARERFAELLETVTANS